MNTLTVTVIDRAAMERRDGRSYEPLVIRTVTISDHCPVCGGPRGEPKLTPYCEDGEWFSISRWVNPCGHLDGYRAVIEEADRPPLTQLDRVEMDRMIQAAARIPMEGGAL